MKRFVLDMVMLVIFLMVMRYRTLPPMMHEVLGLVLLAGAVIHLLWNRRWFSSLFRGKWLPTRSLQTVMNVLLLVSFIASMVTGILSSHHIFRSLWISLGLSNSIFVHQLHIVSSYAMAFILGMHIGMNWMALWKRMKRLPLIGALDRHPKVRFWLVVCIGWAGCAYARLDHVGDRLMMMHIFRTPLASLPVWAGYVLLICFMGLGAIGFYYLQRTLARRGIQRKGGDER